ncbi:MAG: hypothetical protein JXX29_11150 [Deltaproteobacteria bacterium]|nr:hypothetical protein [Deltaproteobacteria bacterium]MBN2672227.1 hypothetical protein [Deltaproteobacteria bacterium]
MKAVYRYVRFGVLGVLLSANAACGGYAARNGNIAFEQEHYYEAAKWYELALETTRAEVRITRKMWDARERTIIHLSEETRRQINSLEKVAKYEAHGDFTDQWKTALVKTKTIASLRKKWFSAAERDRLPEEVHTLVDGLSEWATEVLSLNVSDALKQGKPAVAKGKWLESISIFDAMGKKEESVLLGERIQAAGVKRCEELRASGDARAVPVQKVVNLYCGVFDQHASASDADEAQCGTVYLQKLTLSGLTETQQEQVGGAFWRGFVRTAWFHEYAKSTFRVAVNGHSTVRYSEIKVDRTAPWVERIPYETTEAYDEPYTDIEYYWESEPYTTYRTEFYNCGTTYYQSCSRQVPQTQYRTVQRSRTVTRYRTAYRTVTRYREEPREFKYSAVEHTGKYDAAWEVAMEYLEALERSQFTVSNNTVKKADAHSETFSPAGVSPQNGALPTQTDWFQFQLGLFSRDVEQQLNRIWFTTFCRVGEPSTEQAARCFMGVADATPTQMITALSLFVKDEFTVVYRLSSDTP